VRDRGARQAEQQRYLQGIEAVRDRLMALPNVVQLGVALKETGGELTDQVVIRVSVTEKVPASRLSPDQLVPAEIDGLRTDVIVHRRRVPVIGFDDENDDKNYSPKVGGSRIGNDAGLHLGTLGCFAKMADGSTVFLSNYHVLYDGGVSNGAKIGQPEYSASCCCTCNKIGVLVDGDPDLDCAIAKLDAGVPFVPKVRKIKRPDGTVELDGFIVGTIQPVPGTIASVAGEEVWKVGSRTGLTRGIVSQVSPDVEIKPKAPFTRVADHGDSGSVVVERGSRNVVALLKEIDTATGTLGFATDIVPVLLKLHITILATDQSQDYDVLQSVDEPARAGAQDAGVGHLTDRIRKSPHGEALLATLETYQRECLSLVNSCRRVTLAWHRHQGPTFLAALLRSARVPEYQVPDEVNGVSRAQAVHAMREAFAAHGSPELAAYVRADPDRLAALLSDAPTVEAMITRWETSLQSSAEPR